MVEIPIIVKEKINKLIELLQKDNIKIEKVILFGSYSRGDYNEWSDIDLLIYGVDITDSSELLLKKLAYLNQLKKMIGDMQIDGLFNNVQQGLYPDDFKWFSDNVQLKIDLLSNQENEILVLLNSLEQNYNERYFKDIIYYLSSNLDFVCQLNDNLILQKL